MKQLSDEHGYAGNGRIRRRLESPLDIGDRVQIDGDKDIQGVVLGLLFRPSNAEAEIAWLHNGAHHTAWIALFRLTLVRE